MRTYSGYASAKESNTLYRKNMAKGQTGLSLAFDLPTQTGYDSDHVLAHGEVGKLGVPMWNYEDMEVLFEGDFRFPFTCIFFDPLKKSISSETRKRFFLDKKP